MTNPFPEYRLKSGWNALLPAREPSPGLVGNSVADVVIIGAGFTGLACARRWQSLSPQARIVVIDASEIGEGNPGRNSGFLLEVALAEDADPANTARMAECNRLTRQAMASIVRDVNEYDQPVDCKRVGTYRAAAGKVGLASLRNYQTFLETAELPYRSLNRDELMNEIGSSFYEAGLYSPDCYLVQPASVIRAIASQLPESVTIYENTPAVKIKRSAGKWQTTTPRGSLESQNLVLANNSFAGNLGVAKSRVTAVYTYAGLTPVLPEAMLAGLGTNSNWGLLPCHRLGSTLRRTADNRLLVRSLHHYGREGDLNQIRLSLQDRLWRRFPQLGQLDFEHVWGGAVGITLNGGPVWGQPEPGLLISSGCNGGGTVKGTLFGQLLADLAHGETVPDITSLFGAASWMPPEPFRSVGFHVSAGVESWQGRDEL